MSRSPSAEAPPNPPVSVSGLAALVRAQRPTYEEGTSSEFAQQREERQSMRRLVNPGITRNNDETTAHKCVDCLLALAENILDHPDEEKYRRFKTTNSVIKAKIVDPIGGLEIAQAMGFRAAVDNFQPTYHFTPTEKNVESLRIGVQVLREFQAQMQATVDRALKAREGEKLAAARQKEKTLKAYEDDRKQLAFRNALEREKRLAHLAQQSASPPPPQDGVLNLAGGELEKLRLSNEGGRSLDGSVGGLKDD